jgi:hypothetical protein
MSTEVQNTTSIQHDEKLLVIRSLYEKMKFELSWIEANNGDNKNYLDGYREAVWCMAVNIKQLTGVDVKNGA